MKKLLGLLGTIMITGNTIPSVIAAAPNWKHSIKKRQNNENTLTTPKTKDDQQSQFSTTSDSKVDIIEKEITLNENYSDNIQKMLQELIDENYIDPLRSINMGGLISKELENKPIISKLEELEPKMANWFKNQQNNKDKILILTLKNSNNESVKLVINLNNLYLLGFINNQNQYFYFDDELLKKVKEHNQKYITELNNLKDKLNNLKENKLLFNEEKVKEYFQQKNELIPLKEKEKNIKRLNYNNELNYLNKKIINLQGENLKDEKEKIKFLNKLLIEKYSCQKINLNYTGAYTSDGLDVVIKENGKPDKGKDIIISKDTLNNAIVNLANYNNKQNENIKNDLVRLIFVTSEAMRFQCDEKTLEIFANIENIDELQKIIAGSQNILKNIQEKIFDKKENINWKDYTLQLRGDWKKYSEQLNKFRIEIWEELTLLNNINDFIYNNQNQINEIIKPYLNIFWNKIQTIVNLFKKSREELLNLKNINIDKIKKCWELVHKYWYDIIQLNIDTKENINKILEKIKTLLLEKNKNYEKINDDIFKEILKIIWFQYEKMKFPLRKINTINESMFNSFINYDFFDRNYIIKEFKKIEKEIEKNKISIINFNKNDTNLLYLSIEKKNLDIIRLLIKLNKDKIEINNYWLGISTPLIIAAKEGYIEGVKELLKYENINVNLPEYFENTPLNFAAQNNHLETVKELLDNQNSKNKIKINQKNIDGGVPLFYAINNNNIKIIKLLLNNSNIKIDIKDDNNTSLLYLATQNGCLEIVKLLIEKGKELYKDKEFKEFINAKTNLGAGPLHVAKKIKKQK